MPERFARFESAVETLKALFSEAARTPPGVTRDDPFYPLRGATLEPAPLRTRGPLLILGGQRRRGIALAARDADGWVLPGTHAGDIAYFRDRRDALLRALEDVGRDAATFTFIGQLSIRSDGASLREAREVGLALLRAGADHLTLGVVAREGPAALDVVTREVAEPLRDIVDRT
jgi:alkanesulfonate monooxygenase SsuD/methylene tetrahydromethanopterin reductase-like flavin-dependent oxidoreductase (luciferase family)